MLYFSGNMEGNQKAVISYLANHSGDKMNTGPSSDARNLRLNINRAPHRTRLTLSPLSSLAARLQTSSKLYFAGYFAVFPVYSKEQCNNLFNFGNQCD